MAVDDEWFRQEQDALYGNADFAPCSWHELTITYTRPLKSLFRKKYWKRCWFCDLKEEL